MKIAFIGQNGIPGFYGHIEQNVEEVSVRLVEKGHNVFVYTKSNYTPKEFKKYEGVVLLNILQGQFGILDNLVYYFVSIFRACFVEKVNIIHWQKYKSLGWVMLVKLLRPKIKNVLSVGDEVELGDGIVKVFKTMFLKVILRAIDKIVVNKMSLQRYYLRYFGLSTKLIYDGVNCDRVEDDNVKGVLDRLNLEDNRYFVLNSRCVNDKKTLKKVMSVFIDLKDKFVEFESFKLLVLANFGLKEIGNEYKRSDIILVGHQSWSVYQELLSHSYCVIYPERIELDSMLFAMSKEKSVLVADNNFNSELLNIGLGKSIAFDFKEGDMVDLNIKLELLMRNFDIVKSVGLNSRVYIELYHNWNETVTELDRVYKQVVLINDLHSRSHLSRLELLRT